MRKILVFICVICCTTLFSQTGTVSGILEEENGPLPGVTILVKGTQNGTVTNFDGIYSIECSVGDILVISYIGYKTREILVTENMFSDVYEEAILLVKSKPVRLMRHEDYKENVRSLPKKLIFNPKDQDPIKKKHYGYGKDLYRIAQFKTTDKEVKIYQQRPRFYSYEIEYIGGSAQRFIQDKNLPKLQRIFAQGSNGIDWEGPETGTVFSFGPRLSELGFDNSIYDYDTNGRLIPLGDANNNAIPYTNTLFQNSHRDEHFIRFSIDNENFRSLSGNFKYATIKDVFGRENTQNILAGANYSRNGQQWNLDSSIKFGSTVDNQPNINGFQNLLLFQNYITPSSFDTTQGIALADGTQRSFAPNIYNNPLWLLDTHRNKSSTSSLSTAVAIKRPFTGDLQLTLGGSFTYNNHKQRFGLPNATAGFLDGYASQKTIHNTKVEGFAKFTTNFIISEIDIMSLSRFSISNEQLDYDFNEVVGLNTLSRKRTPQRTNYELLNSITFGIPIFDYQDLDLTLGNTSYISTLQEDALWQPSVKLFANLKHVLDELYILNFINYWGVSTGYSFSNANSPLLYGNTSHNSLNFLPENTLTYTANNDLFTEGSLQLEDITRFEIGNDFRFFRNHFSLDTNFFAETRSNVVFPVLDANYTLANVATVENKGIEIHLGIDHIRKEKLHWHTGITFSKNRTNVTKINSNTTRVPISGFSNIRQNLIVGQPAGIIVGTAFERNTNNQVVIDDAGYPIVQTDLQIIGDPTPDFQVGLSNHFKIGKQLQIAFTIDWRQGGDIWNGTQQVLNYFGRSQESAQLRNTEGFVFEGVNTSGTINTTPVNFLNPNQDVLSNRWTRYGFSGVGESGIVDGTYINLNDITISYDFIKPKKGYEYKTFKSIRLILYGHNLLTYSKYDGASPYTSLFDGLSAQALNFFNTPLVSEIGFKVNLKI
ncbi:carboxypeptidase-like regulatory domain-containing protein [uncultured Dokdonia sp.]|uniref:carboxypeptidase-like regulatory domain-containing protein n=1 Tax=uncultured Dokdonia sp. TaxID=575653 RepID=UPI002621324E|nr:carboxypeptidase-like regulatory domain-containing protein [uncultured Dokdonia sp.]